MKQMRNNILICLLCFTLKTLCQSKDSTLSGKFDVGFTFSPDYSYRTLRTNTDNNWMKDNYDTLEVSRFGYTAGFNIVFHLKKNVLVGSGLLFADKGERTKKYLIPPVNNYTNHYYYLDIPVKVYYYFERKKKYYFSKPKKMQIYLTGGTSVNIYLMNRTTTMKSEKEAVDDNQKLSRINLSLLAGLGIDCPITYKWYFKMEANYRRSITPAANTPIKKYFYSAGLNVGLFKKF